MAANKPHLEAVPAASATKRKTAPKEDEDDDSGSDTGSDVSMINVDFDFYNLNPDVDQIALKRLLRQSLSHDEEIIDVHPLASLILSEGVRMGVGTSIKTDGEESDPWGLVAIVDINRNRDNPAFKPFLDYLRSTLHPTSPLKIILDPNPSPAINIQSALIFSLRMLNLPLPLIPPLYRMMLNEVKGAGRGEVPDFTHWLVWGRGYRLEGGEEGMGLDVVESNGGKKKKKKGGAPQAALALAAGTFPYHSEEEYIDKVASHVHTYALKSAPARDAESFGVEQFGRLVLIETQKLDAAVKSMEDACK